MKKILLTSLVVILCFQLNAQDFKAAQDLVIRRVPWLNGKILFKKIDKNADDNDVFTLESKNKKVVIGASSTSAATKGLGYYLKMYCRRSLSHMGDNLSAPSFIPQITKKETIVSNFSTRYALNYCTINYSMPFYTWEQWAHELDYMALNGVNLMLAPVGDEKVWQKVLYKYGYSDQEIAKFLPGPAFTAWWLMGNLSGWGGPVFKQYIDNQYVLEKQILTRMNQLGIEPIVQGFYGMVPDDLRTKHSDWNIVDQGNWAGGFKRPEILLPTDIHFSEMANAYYDAVKELYGNNIHYFGGEPFHEGGITKGIDVVRCAQLIQVSMQKNVPNATWVLQGWQRNPTDELLDKLDKSHVLIQELFGENTENWYIRKGYNNTPFVWCTVTNFGEKQGLYGKLQRFADQVYRAKNSEYAKYMKGVGIMPEGINNNPVVYEFVLDLNWNKNKVEVNDWIPSFVKARYGTDNQNLQKAWTIFTETVYRSFPAKQEGPPECIYCVRPSLEAGSASSWGSRNRNYDTALFAKGVKLFANALKSNGSSETYKTDKVDFMRQMNSDKAEIDYKNMIDAYKSKSIANFKKYATIFLNGILSQDSLLSTNKYFTLNKWLTEAQKMGKKDNQNNFINDNAKMQLTIWGPTTNPNTNLHDYANKEWSGMMKTFYYVRWKMFVDNCLEHLNGQNPKDVDYFSFEKQWTQND
ncbi:alpha-N-acetylglucosaminidase [Rhizosphaericola mali]|uniref:Alpha-N-acetylglucosaminidase n=1 Tax=Rhizosphaericola mali TaxID=2545455 RepID=A0A5P2FX66_9BACT|nr:alpha-N-acetylglucosaminidase [Rhizosphaericola mali]QES88114.1 alpha-N-acetylglucosaminidase [Rhizosphaericola mali]